LNLKNTLQKLLKLIKRKFSRGINTPFGRVTNLTIDGVPIKPQGLELSYTVVDEATVLNKEQMERLKELLKKENNKVCRTTIEEKLKINPEALKYIRGKFLKEKANNGT